jgi:hypothetical protein
MPALFAFVLALAALSAAFAAPLAEPRRSFFTTSCNSTCGPDLSRELKAQPAGRDLSHQLVEQPTALDRFNLLNASTNNFVFNFLAHDGTPDGPNGRVVLATAGTFPATIGNGVSMGVGE